MKRIFIFYLFIVILSANIFALPSDSANRKTAIKYLKLAQRYFMAGDYNSAASYSSLGLAYDDTVSDLWYINAASKDKTGSIKAEILPFVVKALNEGEWVDYNRNFARILYASLLCDTGSYDLAVSVLDTEPKIYSADAEFIRTKSYYGIGTPETLEKARSKVDDARKIYPDDMRFPRIFFKREYDILRSAAFVSAHFLGNYSDLKKQVVNREKLSPLVVKIADVFIAKMPSYDKPDAELEIYACLFADGEKQLRMLQAFSSHGLEHPLYAHVALDRGLMKEQEAWDYFCSFADKSVFLPDLEQILPFITDEVTKESVREHLNFFSGDLYIDTNNDSESELHIKYLRGRPLTFSWDETNDGFVEWVGKCDFGNPEQIRITEGNILLTYGAYPEIVRAEYVYADDETHRVVFTIPMDSFRWSPCRAENVDIIKKLFDFDFFVLRPIFPREDFDETQLLKYCSGYEIPSEEKPGAKIKFSVLNGLPVFAEYFVNDKRYAYTEFENGFPKIRSVDNDDDGIYETTEIMGFDRKNSMHTSEKDQNQVMTNLFGLPAMGSGVYVKKIQVDRNGDTIPDFSEEYLADGGKITSWDFNNDGKWNLMYKKYPRKSENEILVEEAKFYSWPDYKCTTITQHNGMPVKIQTENEELSVTKGVSDSFYWLGEKGTEKTEGIVYSKFGAGMEQGVSLILETEKKRILAIKIAEKVFAWIVPENLEKEDTGKQ